MTNRSSMEHRCHNMSYGVSYLNQTVYFKIMHASADECYLLLYHKQDASKNKRILMERMPGARRIFTLSLEQFPYFEYEYCFEAQGESFLEPNAKVVLGRETFGKKQEYTLRGGFLTPYEAFEEEQPLQYKFHDLIIYKLHVRGFTMHESSGVEHKGTYRGIIEKIPHLLKLGINAVLIMPMTEFDELEQPKHYRCDRKRINCWGFETSSYLYAPKQSFAADIQHPDLEVKQMIAELHRNGIEVFLEMNFTNQTNPMLIADCLVYWNQEYHVDGFKTNLKEQYRSMIASTPMLRNVKLMDTWWNRAEILEFTEGELPEGLAEYNDGFKVDARKFLKGDEAQVNSYMTRVKYNPEDMAVINYISNHDGFTLHDVYTYDVKHNEANGENNFDGSEYNYSWNCGVEGETKSRKVTALRKKMVENALLALFLSQGTPLLLAGDEFGNTQNGNNNMYCQDNEAAWIDWTLLNKNRKLMEFVRSLIALRRKHPILHQEKEMRAMDYIYCGLPDLSFHGTKAWQPDLSYYSRELGVLYCGKYVPVSRRQFDETFYIIYNMHWEQHEFGLPNLPVNMKWSFLLATDPAVERKGKFAKIEEALILENQRILTLPPRTVCVLKAVENKCSKED